MPRRRRPAIAALMLPLPCLAALAAAGEPEVAIRFVDVGDDRGIEHYAMTEAMGAGLAAADFDDDGDVDLFVPNEAGARDQLYRNLGDGRFEEIAVAAGVAHLGNSRVGLWLDYDGDHRLDLLVAGDCWNAPPSCADTNTLTLFRQVADARFEDVTATAGFGDDLVGSRGPHRGGVCAGDLDGDGYLDLVTGLWLGFARVFLNQRDGTFLEISASSGIGVPFGNHWQQVMHDFDRDGRQDVYTAIDFNENRLWMNQGDEQFVNLAYESNAHSAWNDMGVALGDCDNDGDLDLYITNIEGPSRRNVLYRNDSVGAALWFVDTAEEAGVGAGGWGWGCTFLDADNDGQLDIAATNGWTDGDGATDRSRLFLNQGGPPLTFAEVGATAGFDDEYWGSGLVAFDLERDGDLDLAQTCNGSGPQPGRVRLLENRRVDPADPPRWLLVRPRMRGPNHRAIGAVVRVTLGKTRLTRLITAGTSFLSQEPAEAHFGLGTTARAEPVVVRWPDGRRTGRTGVAADQVITITQPGAGDVDDDGRVDMIDVLHLLRRWGDCGDPDAACPADFDGSGVVDGADLTHVFANWDP